MAASLDILYMDDKIKFLETVLGLISDWKQTDVKVNEAVTQIDMVIASNTWSKTVL